MVISHGVKFVAQSQRLILAGICGLSVVRRKSRRSSANDAAALRYRFLEPLVERIGKSIAAQRAWDGIE